MMTTLVQEVVIDGGDEVSPDGYSYKIDIYTGDIWGAGTDANVLLTIYGEDGSSGQRQLDNSGNNFERDSKDHFKIVHFGAYFGRIQKIKIGHDNSGIGPAWFLDKAMIEDVKSGEVFEFPCNEWFGDESGGLLSRELTYTDVADVNEQDAEKGYLYSIHIYTGTVWGAGTDANVLVTIYGTKGDSDEFRFENDGSSTFEGGVKDTFNVETKDPLGTIYKVRVGHDNTGWGPGWFLDKIEVEDQTNGEVIEFTCGKWLATDSDDGLIRRDLMREGFVEDSESPLEEVTYTVVIYTGNEFGAGTDSNIVFTLYGTAGESEQQTFENEGSTTFENGMVDTVKFTSPYLGTLTKARVGHDNTGWGPAWFLEKVTIEDPKTGDTAVFPCNRWLATNADDGMIERELIREGFFGDIVIEGLPEDFKGEPLGMETDELQDENIKASSHADATPPSNARLNHPSSWCPEEAEDSWLQVDLGGVHCIISVATQGNPVGNNDYVKKYKLQYSQDGDNWTYHEENGNQLFDANEDHSSVKTVELQNYIVGRYIRFYPVEWHSWPSLRVEVYGIPLKEGGTEVKTISYVTEDVVVTDNTEENESVPEPQDEQHRAEDALQFILNQTGDKRKDIEDQKKQIDDEMKQLEEERKEREKRKEEELKQLEEEAKKREEEEEKKRDEERQQKLLLEEERKRRVELEVKKIEEEHKQRLDELDQLMKDEEERKRLELEERKRLELEERKRLELEERKRLELEERKRLELEERKRLELEERKRLELEERKRLELEERKRLELEERKRLELEERKRLELEEKKKADEEELQRLEEEKRKIEEEEQRLNKLTTVITTETTNTDIQDGLLEDGEVVTVTTTTRRVIVGSNLDDEARDEDDEDEDKAVTTVIESETTKTEIRDEEPEDEGEVTVTTITEVIVESSLDDEERDEGKDEEGYVFVHIESEEDRKQRLEDELARARHEKMQKMQEEDEKRQQEFEELSVIMVQQKIKSGDGVDDEGEEKEKKEEAKRLKEEKEKEREEEEREKNKKNDEKAKREAEREKRKILRKYSSRESLSSLSSTSSSSSEGEDQPAVSIIEKTPFRAPIAKGDDEVEDDDGITKLVTYRTTTKTTTRIVSWPGTYFFKPIEPGTREQHLPEDVGLLFGFDDVKPYKSMASCEHLKPEDPAVRSAQESSFSSKFFDDSGPKPVWYGGLDTESTLSINAVRDEDLDRLVEWEKAGDLGWKRTKKSRDFEIWKRKAHEGGPSITKAAINLNGIPYDDAIKILSDWKSRHEWDKTFDKVDVLESQGTSNVIHCPVKKREYVLAVLDRQDSTEPFYASAWRNTTHPKIDQSKSKQLKLFYLVSGLVIRPVGDGSSSRVTLICQVKGTVPSQVKSTFLAAKPAKWIIELKKYHDRMTQDSTVKEE